MPSKLMNTGTSLRWNDVCNANSNGKKAATHQSQGLLKFKRVNKSTDTFIYTVHILLPRLCNMKWCAMVLMMSIWRWFHEIFNDRWNTGSRLIDACCFAILLLMVLMCFILDKLISNTIHTDKQTTFEVKIRFTFRKIGKHFMFNRHHLTMTK